MKKLVYAILACSAFAPAAYAQITPLVNELAEYATPGNKPGAPPSFTYAPDGNGYLMLSPDYRTIDRYDIATGKIIETVFDVANTRENTIPLVQGFQLSDNGRYLLVYTDRQYIYRRSFTAQYYVYELRSRLLKPLSKEHPRQQSPLVSPDGRMVAFVADNNIYIRKNDYDSEVAVTQDGEANKIINGVPDWAYEEEFNTTCSMAWAPDNLTLCFIKYNEEQVPLYTLPIYQGTCKPQDQYALYPGVYSYKYPVAGEKNSVASLHSYDVETRKVKDIALPDSKIEYIPRIAYGGDSPDRLMAVTLNRDQNRMDIYAVNPKSTVARSIFVEETKAWVDPIAYQNLKFLQDGFLIISSKTGYNHLYKYSYAGVQERAITQGEFDVTAAYGADAKGNWIYQAAKPTPMDRIIEKVDLKGRVSLLSRDKGTTNAEFTPDMAHAMLIYSDVQTPPIYTINTVDGKQIRVLEDNAEYAARYANMPKPEFFTMESDGYTLNGYVLRSPNASAPQPVIMSQYSGPGSQMVLNRWTADWENYFAMNGFAIVCVDGRGTAGRGRDFMDVVYKRLGYYETIDQINAAKWAARQPWADGSRIGIWGWSYGGYEALMAASEPGNPYKAAVAIAPVTNWRFYDTIYTERYMLTPQQNEEGYWKGSPLYRVSQLSCPLLIMYGTQDDNVHPQNSLQYVSQLQSNGGLCDMFIFPNMNHSIYGCNARSVVYAKTFEFFSNKLK